MEQTLEEEEPLPAGPLWIISYYIIEISLGALMRLCDPTWTLNVFLFKWVK